VINLSLGENHIGKKVLIMKSQIFSRMLLPWNEQTEKSTNSLVSGGYAQWAPDTEQGNTHAGQH
jgi:hypothetical protein